MFDNQDNTYVGTIGNDVVDALGGDDSLDGANGDDRIIGGHGNDTIEGGEGHDVLYGGIEHTGIEPAYHSIADDDVIYGGRGDDTIYGGNGTDSLFGGAGDDKLYGGNGGADSTINGGAGDDLIVFNGDTKFTKGKGNANGGTGNDVYVLTAIRGTAQMHTYEDDGDDTYELGFEGINRYSYGHHIRGDADGTDYSTSDTFKFVHIDEVASGAVIVGRIEDFDASRDVLEIEGQTVDFGEHNYGITQSVATVKVIELDLDHNDSAIGSQLWLLIENSGGGFILYALEGARITPDLDGGSRSDLVYDDQFHQENHFMTRDQYYELVTSHGLNLAAAVDVGYTDTENYIPGGTVTFDNLTIDVDAILADPGTSAAEVINDVDVFAEDIAEVIMGTTGSNTSSAAYDDLIAGGINDDTIDAQSGHDIIWGGSGNDSINASLGNDVVFGGFGDDSILGSNGNDRISGGKGNDTIDGGEWRDTVNGGEGDDIVFGGSGADILRGQDGNDNVSGGSGNDRMSGGNGNDDLFGGGGHDKLWGNDGNDFINSGLGNDSVYGGNGNDTISTSNGNDVLKGGRGNDMLTGGNWSDTFIFEDGDGDDIITDFGNGSSEIIDLSEVSSLGNFGAVVTSLTTDQNGNAVINYGPNSITLRDISEADFGAGGDIDASNFLF